MNLNYTITSSTILEFDFKLTKLGEVHGIGFDTDGNISENQTFKLAGTQAFGNAAFNYTASTGTWQTFTIPVGQYFTGQFSRLFFVMDHDTGAQDGDAYFRNIKVSEGACVTCDDGVQNGDETGVDCGGSCAPCPLACSLDLGAQTYNGYGNGQDEGTATVSNGELRLTDNAWKSINLNYNVTSETVLEFDFKLTKIGEVHGIAFDNDYFPSDNFSFKLAGTQAWANTDFTYSATPGTWQSFSIPVGQYYTGQFNRLCFIMDHDAGAKDGDAYFSNVSIREVATLDLGAQTYNGYANGQDEGTATISNGELMLTGNAWKSISMNYDVTENTILEFEFKSTKEGEIHGICFDNNNTLSEEYTFKMMGTQAWANTDFTYTASSGNWQSFSIPVGEYYTGQFDRLCFIMDHDEGAKDGNSYYRNVRINEGNCSTTTTVPMEGMAMLTATTSNLLVYPNPAQDFLNISLDKEIGEASYAVIDLYGRVLLQENRTMMNSTLNLNNLAAGMYFLRVENESFKQVQKFIIER